MFFLSIRLPTRSSHTASELPDTCVRRLKSRIELTQTMEVAGMCTHIIYHKLSSLFPSSVLKNSDSLLRIFSFLFSEGVGTIVKRVHPTWGNE